MTLWTWGASTWLILGAAGLAALGAALLIEPPSGRFQHGRFGQWAAHGSGRVIGSEHTVRRDQAAASRWPRSLRRAARLLLPNGSGPRQEGIPREAYSVLAAELRAGRSPETALAAAASVAPCLGSVARVVRSGGDVSAALENIGAGGRALALAWAVSEQAGIGLAALVDRVTDGIADDQEIRREVEAQLAGPRATARMLAGLPVLGLLLGAGFGDPLGFLLGSGYGIACLAASIVLAMLGLLWVERLANGARS